MSVLDADETHRILVVDDSELNRVLTHAVLSRLGDVDCVADGDAALRALDTRHYDLVLMDLDMPVRDGVASTCAIRGRPGGDAETKVFALSAEPRTRRHAHLDEARLDGFVRRPIAPKDLLNAVKSALDAPPAGSSVWRRGDFESLSRRLGPSRMKGFLSDLREECRRMLASFAAQTRIDGAVRHRAHDLCSTSGTMGFEALSHSCRQVLASSDGDLAPPHLICELERALLAMASVLDLTEAAA